MHIYITYIYIILNQPHLFVNFPIPKKARHCEERRRFLRFARNKSEQSHESLSLRGSKSRGNLMNKHYTLGLPRRFAPRNDRLLFLGLPRFLRKLAMTGAKKTCPFFNLIYHLVELFVKYTLQIVSTIIPNPYPLIPIQYVSM